MYGVLKAIYIEFLVFIYDFLPLLPNKDLPYSLPVLMIYGMYGANF